MPWFLLAPWDWMVGLPMLFNSVEFITWFLPTVLLVFFVLGRLGFERVAVGWLILASLFFYGWWRVEYAPLLVGSILVNYFIGLQLIRKPSRLLFLFGILINLGVLGYFKYSVFAVDITNSLFGTTYAVSALLLPLGISFYTFQQIAYLSDARDGVSEEKNFLNYCLFVSFFPQLIAGPIVHHKEMLPQFHLRQTFTPRMENFALGTTIFAIGLFKKVVIADHIALYSTNLFDAAAAGVEPSFFDAWGGALAFTLQLYFDFSGYTDMAVGLGRMFGIVLPLNFNSPYKASNIIEFWSRWHMTLTRFLTAYVYNPVVLQLTRRRMLAGKPALRRGSKSIGVFVMLLVIPTLFTMFLAGIWHGAGYQFIVFGLLHGFYLVINHIWQWFGPKFPNAPIFLCQCWRLICLVITFASVVVSLVFFRAVSLTHAMTVIESMCGLNGFAIPAQFEGRLAQILPPYILDQMSFEWTGLLNGPQVLMLVALMIVVWIFPNTQQWVAGMDGADTSAREGTSRDARFFWKGWQMAGWRPSGVFGVFVGAILGVALMAVLSEAPTEFLYFNF